MMRTTTHGLLVRLLSKPAAVRIKYHDVHNKSISFLHLPEKHYHSSFTCIEFHPKSSRARKFKSVNSLCGKSRGADAFALRCLSAGKNGDVGDGRVGVTSADATTAADGTEQRGKLMMSEVASGTTSDASGVAKKTEPESFESATAKDVTAAKIKDAVSKAITKRKREKFDHSRVSVDRNFVTVLRAMNEYLLKPSDLEGLRKTYRRSPYENSPPITVYLRRDVEAKALEVWGSQEALAREVNKRQEQDQQYREHIFQIKLTVKEYRQNNETPKNADQRSLNRGSDGGLFHGSGKVVLTAVTINATNFVLKLVAWLYTGSHSLFAEAIHSLADTCNQLILAYGVHKSIQAADPDHPYGYSNMKYVASLISGVGIFCFGTGISIYHGIIGLLHPEEAAPLFWAFFILGGALVSEGATLMVAMNSVIHGSKKAGMSLREYVLRAHDPLVNVVLLEDIAAVFGVGIAATCMGFSSYLNSSVPDAIGSILIGGLLGGVAMFIISTNTAALVGRSIPAEKLHTINNQLESDVMIRAIHDAKCLDLGSGRARYKAEIDFDGRELTRSYLEKKELEAMLEEMQKMKTIDELETFMLHHGENIIDLIGGEIDRIEANLKQSYPEIRHCDLEIL